jgi:8-oxo-dGTP pyrophosphatase MutT (NUDIX family)
MTIYGVRYRVACYVTRSTGAGTQLLVFEHVDDDPANPSGIQVPAGGKAAYEAIDEAAFREIEEETGLTGLSMVRQLGVVELGLRDAGGPSSTTYVELSAPVHDGDPTDWIHHVTGDGADDGMRFAVRWEALPLGFELAGGQSVYLDRIAAGPPPRS